jgi:hypothetical protein
MAYIIEDARISMDVLMNPGSGGLLIAQAKERALASATQKAERLGVTLPDQYNQFTVYSRLDGTIVNQEQADVMLVRWQWWIG